MCQTAFCTTGAPLENSAYVMYCTCPTVVPHNAAVGSPTNQPAFHMSSACCGSSIVPLSGAFRSGVED